MPIPRYPAVILLVVAGFVALCACKQNKAAGGARGEQPAVPVSVAKAAQEPVPSELRVIGTVQASAVVQVKTQIAGELVRVHFTEGQNVRTGALLFEIDSRPYREALHQAEAAVTRDRAQIRLAEATLARDMAQSKTAEADSARYTELVKDGVASKTQFEQVRTGADVYRESARASQATIESARAAVESDLAAVERAKLDIAYCEIRAPLSGRTGNLLVHAGNLVKANDVPLVVIHQLTPIFVDFGVPEQRLGEVRRLSALRKLAVQTYSQDTPGRIATGSLSVIDNTVDTTTGTIHLKAVFDNRDGVLWPGQFVNVVLTLDTIPNAVVVPAEAVQDGQQGQFVYVVKPDGTVENRAISAGRTFDRKTVIEKGLAAGDAVVTDGQLRLFPGAHIRAVEPDKPETGKP
jgi:membrane fusion protein, multidrug efflux system